MVESKQQNKTHFPVHKRHFPPVSKSKRVFLINKRALGSGKKNNTFPSIKRHFLYYNIRNRGILQDVSVRTLEGKGEGLLVILKFVHFFGRARSRSGRFLLESESVVFLESEKNISWSRSQFVTEESESKSVVFLESESQKNYRLHSPVYNEHALLFNEKSSTWWPSSIFAGSLERRSILFGAFWLNSDYFNRLLTALFAAKCKMKRMNCCFCLVTLMQQEKDDVDNWLRCILKWAIFKRIMRVVNKSDTYLGYSLKEKSVLTKINQTILSWGIVEIRLLFLVLVFVLNHVQ